MLPALLPPVDREYTICFFYHHKTLNQGDEVAFKAIYPRMQRIAAAGKDEIKRRLGTGIHTSETKVVDNAIEGFVRKYLRDKWTVRGIRSGLAHRTNVNLCKSGTFEPAAELRGREQQPDGEALVR